MSYYSFIVPKKEDSLGESGDKEKLTSKKEKNKKQVELTQLSLRQSEAVEADLEMLSEILAQAESTVIGLQSQYVGSTFEPLADGLHKRIVSMIDAVKTVHDQVQIDSIKLRSAKR